jgi:hypothetical protein
MFRGRGRVSRRDFRRQVRKERHLFNASTTDADARLYRRTNHGGSKLAYLAHILIENRHGLIAEAMTTQADGTAERCAEPSPEGRRRQGVSPARVP